MASKDGNCSRTESLHGKSKIGKAGMAGKSLANQADCTGINRISGSSVCDPANGVLQPAALSQLADKFAAGIINGAYRVVRKKLVRQGSASPAVQVRSQRFVARLQKRPVKMAAVGHP